MRTVADIANICFDYTDVAGVAGATNRMKEAVCVAITGGMQEMFSKRPELFRVRQGKNLEAPLQVNTSLTSGSTAANFSTSNDLRGCTFKSSTGWNQVAPGASSPGNAILRAWEGSTGSQSLRVYGDAFLLGTDILQVMGDVHLDGYGPLRPAPDRATYTAYRDEAWRLDYGSRPPGVSQPRWAGLPEVWWAEPVVLAASTQIYLRFAPIPDRAYSISYDLGLKPRAVVPADIEGEVSVPMPGDLYESVLIPYVLQRWTGSPWFRNAEARAEIARQVKEARNILDDYGAQRQQGCQIVVAQY